MSGAGIPRRLLAELVGSAFLLMAVVGSGIMAQRLTDDVALRLLCNTLPTGAILVVLVTVLGPLSGAHLNPAVTLAFTLRREIGVRLAGLYAVAQIGGAVAGTMAAHLMFELPALQVSGAARTGIGQWLAETVACFGLVVAILGSLRWRPEAVAWTVGLYIVSAYWFTASTSFANPAVTLARSLTDTFSGIRPADAPGFVAAQVLGAVLAVGLGAVLFGERPEPVLRPPAPRTWPAP